MKKPITAGPAALAGAVLATLLAAPAARAEIGIIVSAHAANPPQLAQVCQAYLGKIKTPTPINFSEKNPLRDEFYAKACNKTPAQVLAMWSKLILTGTGTPPTEVDGAAAMKKAVAADPNAVGYINKKDLDPSVTIIATPN
jgi:hypothetical protein